MSYQIEIKHRLLNFKEPAQTSRGAYITRDVWYLLVTSPDSPGRWGVGECAPLPDLSCDLSGNFNQLLCETCLKIQRDGTSDTEDFRSYPSIRFALETAFRQFNKNSFALWDTSFSQGKEGLPINGLVWMSTPHRMLEQVEAKIAAGFRCIKLKIGAIAWEEELNILRHIRMHFKPHEIEIRVDANGAFTPEEAGNKLKQLAEWEVHSIEQPIATGQWEEMAKLTAETPVPIALDEELIGIHPLEDKKALLQSIKPQYIIIKPSLHGGFSGGDEWIEEAEKLQIGWWITSALESNIGLNAVAQWCASLQTTIPQGLGTGSLFTDNIEMPLEIRDAQLWYSPDKQTPEMKLFRNG